jgi:hypothetical protein
MPVTLTQGTKEYLFVEIDDLLNVLTTLDGTTPKFDVKTGSSGSGTLKYDQQAATNTGMRVNCLVDTSAAHPGGLWAAGAYRLYIYFTTAPELPKLGPFAFDVSDA